MTINYQNNGNGTATVTISYTADKGKVDATLEDVAKYWNDMGVGGPWGSLTANQRLQIVDEVVKRQLLEWAKIEHTEQSVDAARATAAAENETRYI